MEAKCSDKALTILCILDYIFMFTIFLMPIWLIILAIHNYIHPDEIGYWV